jgi:UDP-N-acetylmuramate: L-alanyl-gamma-D-glutamyl-meso-diaminopimelate ligase
LIKTLTAEEIYNQNIDKQRILIVGGGCDLISSLILHVLKYHNRKFDQAIKGNPFIFKDESPLVIINNDGQLIDYKHHILLFGNDALADDLDYYESIADATPKGGTLIFPKNHPGLSKIGTKERTDVQTIPYETYKHETTDGQTFLITSTKERFPVNLSGAKELACISGAKELLKKIGISSGQFYKAVSEFNPS